MYNKGAITSTQLVYLVLIVATIVAGIFFINGLTGTGDGLLETLFG